MNEAEAQKEARTLMQMRETAQALGLSYLADGGVEGWEQFKYEPWQMQLLVEAWAPIVQGLNFRVNKYVRVLYAEGIASGPMVMTALKARSHRLENERLKEQLYEMQMQQMPAQRAPDNAIMQPAQAAKPAFDRMNYDSKRMWDVDANGFFTQGADGKYIPQGKRREKPLLKPDIYQRLCKWNGKEKVDRIFNV